MRSNLESDHREEVFCCVEWGARAYFLSLKHCWLPTIVSHTRVFKKIHFSRHHRENLKLFKGISISRISWARLFLTRTQEWRKSTTQKTQKQAHASYKAKDMNAQTSISSSTMKSLTFDLKENLFILDRIPLLFSQKKLFLSLIKRPILPWWSKTLKKSLILPRKSCRKSSGFEKWGWCPKTVAASVTIKSKKEKGEWR